jgi:hypothetical protein
MIVGRDSPKYDVFISNFYKEFGKIGKNKIKQKKYLSLSMYWMNDWSWVKDNSNTRNAVEFLSRQKELKL